LWLERIQTLLTSIIGDEEVDDTTTLGGNAGALAISGLGWLAGASNIIAAKAESEYDQSEDEEPSSRPPRKRQRTSVKQEKSRTRRKQVRGKQGGLSELVNMPLDIFTEV
jgi:hypothetical protein